MRKSKKENIKKTNQWCIDNRKALMDKITPAENLLYESLPYRLKRRAIRQYPLKIDGKIFFADIYIERWHIVIEVDGGYHNTPEQQKKDAERTEKMKKLGIRVYRISNEDVFNPIKKKEFISMLTSLKFSKLKVENKNTVNDKSIDPSKSYYGKKQYEKDKKRLDTIIGKLMNPIKSDTKAYMSAYMTCDKRIIFRVWLSKMTVLVDIKGGKKKSYRRQTWGMIEQIINKIRTLKDIQSLEKWLSLKWY